MNIFNVASPTDIRVTAVKSFLQNVYSVLWFVENVCREFVFFWYFQQKQIYLHVFNVIQRSDYMLLNLKIECMNGWNSFSDRAHLHCIQILCVGLFQEWFLFKYIVLSSVNCKQNCFLSSQRNKHVFCPLTCVPNWSILQLCWLKIFYLRIHNQNFKILYAGTMPNRMLNISFAFNSACANSK